MNKIIHSLLFASLIGLLSPAVYAEQVYGRQLMTEQELAEHRNQMRNLRTEQEREAYRMEHHKRMQERARERGVTLPEEPMQRGKGMGMGKGQGMGQGQGMGMGKGQGR